MSTKVRDWAAVDYYAMLGVPAEASDDEIARAFRTRAKHSHPDVAGDGAAAEDFKELTSAYAVLGDRHLRREYDRVRATVMPVGTPRPNPARPPAVPRPAPHRSLHWTPRLARAAVIAGVIITVLGVLAAFVTIALRQHDASLRESYVPVTAARTGEDQITFSTLDGAQVVTAEPRQHGEGTRSGRTVAVRYDPDDPQRVVVDGDTLPRDITLAIVALKLLVGGPVLLVVGRRARRTLAAA